jgi:hypothetical protein
VARAGAGQGVPRRAVALTVSVGARRGAREVSPRAALRGLRLAADSDGQDMASRLKLMCVATATLATVGCGDDRRDPEAVSLGSAAELTVVGCIAVDKDDGRTLLWIVDEPALAAGVPRSTVGQSTSVSGPWAGTRQLALTGERAATLRDRVGERVRVTGTIQEQVGTTGTVDQIRIVRGAQFQEFTVDRFEPAPGGCALDSRYMDTEPTAGSSGHRVPVP